MDSGTSTSSISTSSSDRSTSPMVGIAGGSGGGGGGGSGSVVGGLDCKGFKQLLDTQSLVDCTLACDGGKVSAHKIVLSACSSYLAKILIEHPVEHPIIILPELGIEDVRTLVHYMYTGDLLKSSTINSISLLRTAAILSINSLNDPMLASQAPRSPATVVASNQQQNFTSNAIQQPQHHHRADQHQLFNNGNLITQPLIAQQQHGISLVDQISPLLAAITQQHQYKLQLQQFNGALGNQHITANDLLGLSRNNSASSQTSNLSVDSSSLSSIIGALGAATSSGNNYYNSLTNHQLASHTPSLTSSSGSAPSSPNNYQCNTLQPQDSQPQLPHKPEPFAYSSAITGTSKSVIGGNSSSSGATTSEFQFKCPTCQNHFQTICSFEYHMQRVHSVTSFGCEICHKPFASLRYILTDHMRRCHSFKVSCNNPIGNSLINNQQAGDQQQRRRQHQQKVQC